MDFGRLDGIMLLYNFALVLSGGFVVRAWGITDRFAFFGAALALAVGWTIYFRWAMIPRVRDAFAR